MDYVFVIFYLENNNVLLFFDSEENCIRTFRILNNEFGLKSKIDWRAINLHFVINDLYPLYGVHPQ